MKKIAIFVAILFMSVASFAETATLFTPTYDTSVSSETTSWPKTFASIEAIEFNTEALASVSVESMEFQIDGISHRAVRHHTEIRSERNFSWFGYVEGSQFLSHFAVIDGAVAGEIWLPLYSSGPNGFQRSIISRGGRTFLARYDDAEVSGGLANDVVRKPIVRVSTGDTDDISFLYAGRRRGLRNPRCYNPYIEIRLLYVYDQTAEDWFVVPGGSVSELFALGQATVDRINATTANSKPSVDVRVRLVGFYKTNNFYNKGYLYEAIGFLRETEVQSLRNEFQADVVGMWVGVGSEVSNQLGLSGGFDGSNSAYHAMMVGGGTWVATHEFGHNLGMDHQPEDVGTVDDPYPFARGHYVNLLWRTTMAVYKKEYCPNFCDPIPVWSNPSILWSGLPTGIKDERENWRMVAITGPVVASYMGESTGCLNSSRLFKDFEK